jgi:hypothetical protein
VFRISVLVSALGVMEKTEKFDDLKIGIFRFSQKPPIMKHPHPMGIPMKPIMIHLIGSTAMLNKRLRHYLGCNWFEKLHLAILE